MCGELRSKHALIQKRPKIKLKKSIFINFNYVFYSLCDSEVNLKELGQTWSFSVKSEILIRGQTPSYIYNKIYEYRSLLRKLICKLCIFFTNENVR